MKGFSAICLFGFKTAGTNCLYSTPLKILITNERIKFTVTDWKLSESTKTLQLEVLEIRQAQPIFKLLTRFLNSKPAAKCGIRNTCSSSDLMDELIDSSSFKIKSTDLLPHELNNMRSRQVINPPQNNNRYSIALLVFMWVNPKWRGLGILVAQNQRALQRLSQCNTPADRTR